MHSVCAVKAFNAVENTRYTFNVSFLCWSIVWVWEEEQGNTAALHIFGYELESGGNDSDVSPAATLK